MALFDIKPKKEYVPEFIQPKQFTEDELPIASKIQQRRIQMLVHSRLYYKLDENLILDHVFDKWATELRDLQNQYPDIAKRICFAEFFDGWDGSTGFHLPLEHPWVVRKVNQLLSYRQHSGGQDIETKVEYPSVKPKAGGQHRSTDRQQKSDRKRVKSLF